MSSSSIAIDTEADTSPGLKVTISALDVKSSPAVGEMEPLHIQDLRQNTILVMLTGVEHV